MVADSTGGYAPPLTGTAISINSTFVKNGVVQTTYSTNLAGVEDGLLDCMSALGYQTEFDLWNVNGSTASYGMATAIPDAITYETSIAKIPDILIVSFGTNDAKTWSFANSLNLRVFGPAYDGGNLSGLGGPFPGETDRSIIGQARTAWGSTLPIIDIQPYTRNNEDWLLGSTPTTVYPHIRLARARLAQGCSETPYCDQLETQKITLRDGVHPDSQGFYDVGWSLCNLITMRSLLY